MHTRTVGLDVFSLRPTPVCCHPQISPQTSGRFTPRCSNEHSRKRLLGTLGGSLRGQRRRKEWILRAGGDGNNKMSTTDKETLLFLLDTFEDVVRGGRDLIDGLEPKNKDVEKDLPEGMVNFLKRPSENFRTFFPVALEKIREAKAKIVAGENVNFDELSDQISSAIPFDPMWTSWLRAFGYTFGIFTLGWLFGLVGIDGWAQWKLPNGGVVAWLQWTAPHVFFSVLFWQNFLSERIPSLKAYKLAQANTQTEEMSIAFVNGASSFDLAVEALFLSFKLVFQYQGLYLNCLASGFAVQPPDVSVQGAMGGLAVQQTLPKVFRIPLEIGSMGLLTSVGSILSDPTMSPFSIQTNLATGSDTNMTTPTPLRQSKSVEELTLLTSQETTRNRTWITAALFFVQGIYLTSETIATNSLIAPIATNAISLFVFLKAVQEMKSTPPAPNPQEP